MDPPLYGLAFISQNDFKGRMKSRTNRRRVQWQRSLAYSASTSPNRSFTYLVGMDEHGTIQLRKRLARAQVMTFIAQLPPTLIGMEACSGAHYWARRVREHGHEVKLMAPQFVTPYRKAHKNAMR